MSGGQRRTKNPIDHSDLFEVKPSGKATTIYFDGGCAPNPGRMSSCIVVCRPGQQAVAHVIENLGHGTNNAAEWSGLIWAVLWAKDNGIQECVIRGDSKLAIMQARGTWKINNQLLSDLFKEFKKISEGLDLALGHVYRDSNLAGIYLEHGTI
jgi:ribonuclease HI